MGHLQRPRCMGYSGSSHYRLDFSKTGTMSSYFLCDHHEWYVGHRCFTIYWTNYKLVRLYTSSDNSKGMPNFTLNLHCDKWTKSARLTCTKLAWHGTESLGSFLLAGLQAVRVLPAALVPWTHWRGPALYLWFYWAYNSGQWTSPMQLVLSYNVNPM